MRKHSLYKYLIIIAMLLFIFMLWLCYRGVQSHDELMTVHHEYDEAVTKSHRYHKRVRQPIIHKTIPSAYKMMLEDGHNVCHVEQQVMAEASKSKYPSVRKGVTVGQVHTVSTPAQSRVLHQYLDDGGVNGEMYTSPWSSHHNDRIRIIPGSTNVYGDYECAFIAQSPKGSHLDAIYTCTYDPKTRTFHHVELFGSNSSSSSSSKPKTSKHNKKHVSPKRVAKKNVKKNVARVLKRRFNKRRK